MSSPEDDPAHDPLARRLREALRESEELDYVSSARLRAARARALEAAGRARSRRGLWTTLGGSLAAAALVLMLAPWRGAEPPAADASVDTLALLLEGGSAVDESEAALDEQLELYLWLGEQGELDG